MSVVAGILAELSGSTLKALGIEFTATVLAKPANDVAFHLLNRISGMLPYGHLPDLGLHFKKMEWGAATTSEELHEVLRHRKRPRMPVSLTVEGVFLPGSLLSFGWWDRDEDKSLLPTVSWRQDPGIQRWLFNGFEQWAPSWDINDWSEDGESVLLGQIGTHDEAESIPVLIEAGAKARSARNMMAEVLHKRKTLVAAAKIAGLLCPAEYVERHVHGSSKKLVHGLISSNRMPKYCLVVQADNPKHKVETNLRKSVDLYSGYIWRCYRPEKIENDSESLLPHSYFVWEHTDFSDRDAVNYNLDSLNNKVKYLQKRSKEKRSGKLVMLQHMMPEFRLRGDGALNEDSGSDKPLLDSREFLNLFKPLDTE